MPLERLPTVGAWWATSVAVAAITASRWLETPSVQYVVVWVLATVTAAVLALRLQGVRRGWAVICVVLLGIGLAIAGRSQLELARIAADWRSWQESHARSALEVLREELTETQQTLSRTAASALDVSTNREVAFGQLRELITGPDERAIVL
jgi:hypothetical protein